MLNIAFFPFNQGENIPIFMTHPMYIELWLFSEERNAHDVENLNPLWSVNAREHCSVLTNGGDDDLSKLLGKYLTVDFSVKRQYGV